MKLLWLTDPHLNFAGIARAQSLLSQASSLKPDAFLISGDIGESHDLEGWLMLSAQSLDCPIYFVLGNHDYYGSSIAQVRADVSELCTQHAHLTWLSELKRPIPLSDSLAMIGHDGWGDGRAGDLTSSRVRLNDFIQIQELRALKSTSAIATTLAGWTMFACLALGARRYGTAAKFDARFHKRIWRILAASLAMGLALWAGNLILQPVLGMPWWRGLGLIALLAIGAVSYFGIGHLIGAFRLSEFKGAIRRKG